jgi:short-subunit dehydrogenase
MYTGAGYASTKCAVVSVMECLHGQLRDVGSKLQAGIVFPPLAATNLGGGGRAVMEHVEASLRAGGVPATLVEPEEVAAMVLDGIRRDRFWIRAGLEEGKTIFSGKITPDYLEWDERMIRGRADAMLNGTKPDPYLWGGRAARSTDARQG